MQPSILGFLKDRAGHYRGEGRNHEGEPFRAEMRLEMLMGDLGTQISFTAQDAEMVFHQERTWVTLDLLRDRMAMWTISTNTPGMLQLELTRDSERGAPGADLAPGCVRSLAFMVGAAENLDIFRQEIAMDFFENGDIEYRYSWGLPGEAISPKSQARLRRL